MSRAAILFLVLITLGLSLLLSFLGWMTMGKNYVGWFLLVTGLAYFFGVIVVYWIQRVRFWGPRAGGEMVGEERGDWSFWSMVIGMIAVFYLPPVEYLYFKPILPRGIGSQITGWILILLGSMLFLWARRALGEFYSGHVSVVEGQPLVQSGPYRFIRHPAYAGYLVIALGISVGYSSLTGLILIPTVLFPSVIYRLGVEDRLLEEYFGDQFRDYAKSTARLIPGIW